MSNLKDYLKCAYANYYTKSGASYLACAVTLEGVEEIFNLNETIMFFPQLVLAVGSSLLLAGSLVGKHTFNQYLRAKEKFSKHKDLPFDTEDVYQRSAYCTKVGIYLAAQESGLEERLSAPKPNLLDDLN